MKQDFIIDQWNVWPPFDSAIDQKLMQKERLLVLPTMLKRRLTPLARVVFSAAIPCMNDNKQIPTVFSSTHGELAKSFKMMEMIEAGEEISPTAFSLSVHNSIAGLFSMAFDNKAESTVVAPGEEGIAAAFIEVLGLLQEGEKQVLMVFYDEPLVKFYPSTSYKLSEDQCCALALKISNRGRGIHMSLSCLQEERNDGEQPVQIPMFIRFLSSRQKKLLLSGSGHSWCWEKL